MEFSDESDSEASSQAELKVKPDASKKKTSRRVGQSVKTEPPSAKVPIKKQTKGKRNTSAPCVTSSEDDEALICPPASTRRLRTRKPQSRSEEPLEGPDTMRTIVEETDEVLNISIEQLRTSDTEAEENLALSKGISVFLQS